MANSLGDPTARLAGRLTLNPLKHIDPVGTIFLPLLLVLTHSPLLIGYAKPVPYNPYNLRGKWGEGLVAFAGPGTNVLLALVFGFAIRGLVFLQGPAIAATPLIAAFQYIVFINLLLALFNLIPIPPLDGSKVLSAILPGALARGYDEFRYRFERIGILSMTLLILLIFYFLLAPLLFDAIQWVFSLITGL